MPPHLKQRDSVFYLIDGDLRRSLKTKKKGLANYLLEQHIKGKYGLGQRVTVKGYYEQWIETKREPLVRRSTVRDYRQHFSGYLLSEFGSTSLATIDVSRLSAFRAKLLTQGLSVKTCLNLLNGSFRALWRDAMIANLVDKNPFALLRWPRKSRHNPNPFKSEERERIVAWWAEHDFFFFPYVAFQFYTGMRPSETAALTWQDIDFEAGTISINKSRNLGADDDTKTDNSDRIIPLDAWLRRVLEMLPSRQLGIETVFVGKRGNPMSKKWAEHNWAAPLRILGITHRKFYCTRHTSITEAVLSGQPLKAIADYYGTSVQMIEQDYCARQGLNLHRTVVAQSPPKYVESLVAGPGFEPGQGSISKRLQLLSDRNYEDWKKAKVG